MAEKLKLPNQVINAEWKDDIDVEYATYGDEQAESQYQAPEKISRAAERKIEAIKKRNIKLGKAAFLGTIFKPADRLAA